MKAKDKYENSCICADTRDLLFSAFGLKICEDDQETCPPKFCHKCYKLASRGGTRFCINGWPVHKRTGDCVVCSSYKEQQKPGRKKKSKPGVKPRDDCGSKEVGILEGMSGTVSFPPDENINLFCQQIEELKSYRGTEPLYPEQFAENIKYEYICPICKEVLDQPVQTKSPTPHIFCASCLSFAIGMCGPQCPVCRTAIDNPKEFVQPAPFVLQTIISELDFNCPTCNKIIKLQQYPKHQDGCIPLGNNSTVTSTVPIYRVTLHEPQPTVAAVGTPSTLAPVSAEVQPTVPAQPPTHAPIQLPGPVQGNDPLPVPGPQPYGGLTIQQLLHSPSEALSSLKEEVGLFIIRQFLAKSQDGATILRKTGGLVNIIS